MRHVALGHKLPDFLSIPLFGDRKKYGVVVQENDPCWKEWEQRMHEIYSTTQKESVGAVVNNAGYTVMEKIDMHGKRVLEIGPGTLEHIQHWAGLPAEYIIADVRADLLETAEKQLQKHDVSYTKILLDRQKDLSEYFEAGSFDIIVSFYSLEHLHPLDTYLSDILELLKPGGLLVGGIPCEGGLGWGLGRFVTTRRWFKKHTSINPDKLICWEHPNFADTILNSLRQKMSKKHESFWPVFAPVIDLNLIARFIYEKR